MFLFNVFIIVISIVFINNYFIIKIKIFYVILLLELAQSAGAAEYTDCISVQG